MKSLKLHLFVIACILISFSSHAWATAFNFGQTQAGTIGSPGQSDSYSLSANANDLVDFTMAANGLSPKIQFYTSGGTLLFTANPGNCYGSTIEENTFPIPANDTYIVVVSDCAGTHTGDYWLYAQRTNNPSGAANLSFDQTPAGTIGSPAQSDSYTFNANANDVVDFTMAANGISPKIRLYNPNGTLLSSANPGNCYGSTIEMNTVTLPTTGTYTVLAGDCADYHTGTYALYAQRTNNPSGAVNLPYDQAQAGTIGSAAQSNTYTLSANANDVVDFTMAANGISPKLRLYNPDGTLLASGNPGNCYGSTLEMNAVTLPVTGTYTVLAGDCADYNAGSYDIYVQRTENPYLATVLMFGQTQTGTISAAAQSNTYIFSANANELVDFTMAASGISPKIRIYNPNGTLLASANPGNCYGSTVELNVVQIPTSGIYTALVGDCADYNTGTYAVYAQATNTPSGPAILLLNQTQAGTIGSAAQNDTYTFNANANDVVDFTMAANGISPKIRLYNPTGTLLASANPGNCYGSTVEMNTVTLPVTGAYTVLAGDCADYHTGTYAVYAQRTNNPFGPIPFLFGGQTETGNIVSAAQSDTYTFSGSVSNVVDVTMVGNGISPKIRLYNPDGTLLASANPGNCYGNTISLNSVTLPQNGAYTLLVGDCADYHGGSYNLSGLCFGTCPPVMPAINWPAPAPITYPTPLSSTQLDATSPVAGTFVYNPPAGTVLAPGLQNLSVTFTPDDPINYSTAMDSVQLMVNSPYGAGVSPTALSFKGQLINTTSAPKTVTLSNTGTAALNISNIFATANFAVSSTTCKATLAVHKTCKVKVTFTPTQPGPVIGALVVTDNAPNSPQLVALSGTGKASVMLTPASATYKAQKVGTTSKPKTFTLTNNQSVTLNDIAISTTGDFAVSATTCTTSLAAKGKCTISVTFTPAATGTRTGQLSVSDSASNSPQTSTLTGTGK